MAGRQDRRAPVSLGTRVAIAVAFLMLTLGAIASQYVLSTLDRLNDARLREVSQLHVEGLAVALGPLVLHQDIWEVYDTLERARSDASKKRLLFTVVTDEKGQVIAASDPERAPVGSDARPILDAATPPERLTAAGTAPVLTVRAPVTFGGRTVGEIASEIDVSDLLAERRRVSQLLVAGNAALTLVMTVVAYFVIQRMLRPIATLTEHMLATGDAPTPVPDADMPPRNTELRRLLETFNTMTGAIEARTEAERRLAERERYVSLGRLSSSLAHEINNPLGGLLNAADTIRSYPDRPEVVKSAAELIERGLLHLKEVSRTILAEHRVDRQATPLSGNDFNDLRVLFEPEATRRRVALDWDVAIGPDETLPIPSGPVRQIALNLLLNAASATPAGRKVGLSARTEDEALVLTVWDEGPGLDEAALGRLTSDAGGEPGGGVGLRVVRELSRSLSGKVEYARREGRTQITVRLPTNRDT